MMPIILFIVFMIWIFVIDSIIIGLVYGVFRLYYKKDINSKLECLLLIIIFALNGLYILPISLYFDFSFTIGNEAIANIFNLKPNMRLHEFLSFGVFDIIIYGIQAIIAQWLAYKFVVNKFRKE